ncbi:MAG TPA: rod shape-determining protein [Gaiellaceae bacterium]|jgi:rod shape-determining protein MreB
MGILRHLSAAGRRDMAVDLGTANTVVYVRGEGIVLFEPSVVAIDDATGDVHAVGEEAKRMIGRTPASIRAIRPLRDGVIADFDVTEAMLRHFIRKTLGRRAGVPRVVLCVPSGITEVEERAVQEAAESAGAGRTVLIDEPMAAAIGADLPVEDAAGNMVVDIGGGTTEVAVIALGGIVVSTSIKVGGYEMDDAIAAHVKSRYGLLIGQDNAEQLKIELGSAWDVPIDGDGEARGRDQLTGLGKRIDVDPREVREALARPVGQILDAVRDTLERTPPELAADITSRGIVLVGGGTLLRGLDERIRDETGLPVQTVESPLTTVAIGAGRSLDEFQAMERSSVARRRGRRQGRVFRS